MFDELVTMLDAMGVDYNENYDDGTLTIDISKLQKTEIISLVQAVNDTAMAFTIDESSLVVTGGEIIEEASMDEEVEATPSAEASALDEYAEL